MMRSLREQFEAGTAMVGKAKLHFLAFGRTVKLNRGILFQPEVCTDALLKAGFQPDMINEIVANLWQNGDLAALLREFDSQGSPAKKARDAEIRRGAYQATANEEASPMVH